MILLPQSLSARIIGISHHYGTLPNVYEVATLQTESGVWGQSPAPFPSDTPDDSNEIHVRTTALDSLGEGVSRPKER